MQRWRLFYLLSCKSLGFATACVPRITRSKPGSTLNHCDMLHILRPEGMNRNPMTFFCGGQCSYWIWGTKQSRKKMQEITYLQMFSWMPQHSLSVFCLISLATNRNCFAQDIWYVIVDLSLIKMLTLFLLLPSDIFGRNINCPLNIIVFLHWLWFVPITLHCHLLDFKMHTVAE